MIIHREYQQKSLMWEVARSSIPTASEFDQLVTPKWEIRKGQMPLSYLHRKLAAKWLGGPLPSSFKSFAVDEGNILEEEALPWANLELDTEIDRIGFITTDDRRAGCSPDGMMGEFGIEIKCPGPAAQVEYLLNNTVPDEYLGQVQGSIYITGAPFWYFVSYHRRLPKLLLKVEPDMKAQEAIAEALELFHHRFDNAWKILCDLNGGPPPERKPLPPDAAFAGMADETDPAWMHGVPTP